MLFSEIVNFGLKREFFNELARNCFKTTEKHSLAVCGSIWLEKKFLLRFPPFYLFDQKQLFKQIQIFLRISPISYMLKNKLSEYFSAPF